MSAKASTWFIFIDEDLLQIRGGNMSKGPLSRAMATGSRELDRRSAGLAIEVVFPFVGDGPALAEISREFRSLKGSDLSLADKAVSSASVISPSRYEKAFRHRRYIAEQISLMELRRMGPSENTENVSLISAVCPFPAQSTSLVIFTRAKGSSPAASHPRKSLWARTPCQAFFSKMMREGACLTSYGCRRC